MTDSYPALIELISRLEGKDKKTCELALYCLNRADDRDKKIRAENEKLRAALQFYAEEKNWRRNGPLDANGGNYTGGPASSVC